MADRIRTIDRLGTPSGNEVNYLARMLKKFEIFFYDASYLFHMTPSCQNLSFG